MARNESTTPALLGLLSIEPMSGYDMRAQLKISMGDFWSESWGQIYPTLKRLATDGLIQSVVLPTKGKRSRQVYELTAKGRAHLRQWLALPPQAQQPRDEFLLKLFLGSSAPDGAISGHIRARRAKQEAARVAYQTIHDYVQTERTGYPDQKYWLLMLERALALRQAEIAWCDGALAALERDIKPSTAPAAAAP